MPHLLHRLERSPNAVILVLSGVRGSAQMDTKGLEWEKQALLHVCRPAPYYRDVPWPSALHVTLPLVPRSVLGLSPLVSRQLCFWLLFCNPLVSLVVLPPHSARLFTLIAQATMVRPRQRLLSRRGSTHGGSSRPPAEAPPPHRCSCCCHDSAPANPLKPRNFMDCSSPGPNS